MLSLPAAREYVHRGWAVIPVPLKSKRPILPQWQKLKIKPDELEEYFKVDCNVGVILGEPSGGLIDIDLDCKEAVKCAGALLPRTTAIFGRRSNPGSHWLYQAEGQRVTNRFKDPNGQTLIEYRATGAQTVFPPSIHESGEQIEWLQQEEPTKIDAGELFEKVKTVAAASLILRYWPEKGRHDACLALAGGLYRKGWSEKDALEFIEACTVVTKANAPKDRANAVRDTYRNFDAKKTTGWTGLSKILGEQVSRQIREWIPEREQPKIKIETVKVKVETNGHHKEEAKRLTLVTASTLTVEEVSWLWHPRIPQGKVTMIEGDPGLGKSWILFALASAISTGAPMPGSDRTDPRDVILFSGEDGARDTILPRLISLKADLTKIHLYTFEVGKDEPLILDEVGCVLLHDAIMRHKPAMVAIDPLVGYLGAQLDMHRANETRAVMMRLAYIAQQEQCAIVALRHLTKGGTGGKAIYRGYGSIDLTAAARSVLLVGEDPDTQKRGIVHIKSNLAPQAKPIGYELRYPDGFLWALESELTADQILGGVSDPIEQAMRKDAKDMLVEILLNGPMAARDVELQAKQAGACMKTFHRAKAALGIVSKRVGKEWFWMLPMQTRDFVPPPPVVEEERTKPVRVDWSAEP